MINALLRADELEQGGHWVRISISTPAFRVHPCCRIVLEWGDLDGGIEQKSICTERFYEDGTRSKHSHL